jgi:hypothetical protein
MVSLSFRLNLSILSSYLLSPSSVCSTRMMAKQVSRPMKSAKVSGPMGTFVPNFLHHTHEASDESLLISDDRHPHNSNDQRKDHIETTYMVVSMSSIEPTPSESANTASLM